MAKKKKEQQPDLIIEKVSHLYKSTNTHTGEVKLIWDWDQLLQDVKDATKVKVDLIAETESKIKKTRKKK